ncbi:sister chromatid cohesion protein DCC1, partial [Paragonimus westermani]
MSEVRSVELMKELLHCAKLDDSCSCGPIQSVAFSHSLASDNYKVFEVSNELAEQLIRPGAECVVELKDEPREGSLGRAFLCTEDQTFAIVEAETSNSLLLTSNWYLPNSDNKAEMVHIQDVLNTTVNAIKTSYYELNPCIAPSLRLLKQLLCKSVYHGPATEESTSTSDASHFSREDLSRLLPCSQSELTSALMRLRACEVNGKIRIMDVEYLNQVIRDIFSCADEHAWQWRVKGFPLRALLDILAENHDRSVLQQIIPLYFAQRRSSTFFVDQSDTFVFPRNSKICQLVGEHLLSVTHSFDLTDFLAVWKAAVPDGLRPKLRAHLTCAGRAFSQQTSAGPLSTGRMPMDMQSTRFRSISRLCSEDLPDESVDARLATLFQRSISWPEAELASYLSELVVIPEGKLDKPFNYLPNTTAVPYVSSGSDSDFDYTDPIDLDGEVDRTEEAFLKPIPPTVGSVLSRLCRVTNTKYGRFYTEKHSVN